MAARLGLAAAGVPVALAMLPLALFAPPGGPPPPASSCSPAGAPGGAPGGPSPDGSAELVGATQYGGPGDPSSGDVGAYGPLPGRYGFAELSTNYGAPADELDFAALGGLAPHALVQLSYNGRSVVAEKLDVGRGGPPVGDPPTARKIDLWYETAAALGLVGSGLVAVSAVAPGTDAASALVPGGQGASPVPAPSPCLVVGGSTDGAALLANPRIQFSDPRQSDDIASGRIDARIIAALSAIAHTHTIVVTSLRSDHSPCAGGSGAETADGGCANGLSNHSFGRAADIGVVDGEAVSSSSAPSRALVDAIIASNAELGLSELGQPFYDGTQAGLDLFSAGHGDHVHLGIDG